MRKPVLWLVMVAVLAGLALAVGLPNRSNSCRAVTATDYSSPLTRW